MTDTHTWPDLASERLGGSVLAANDEFFAPKENLIRAEPPVFKPDLYTERGKWMDGWESRRRREPGHDWCVLRLGAAGIVQTVVVDTTHFRGNHPEACAIEACGLEGTPTLAELERAEWTEIVPYTELAGDTPNELPVDVQHRVTHVRLRIYPDGGVARLRVYGEALPRWGKVHDGGLVDVASALFGGRVVAVSDDFFASEHHLLLPGPATNMGDGWETRRRRGPGNDWCVIRLGARGAVRRAVVDTTHYKGNAPGSCTLEGCFDPEAQGAPSGDGWRTLLEQTPLQPHTVHRFDELADAGELTHVRLSIYPDGGIARIRLLADVGQDELMRQGTRWLDALPPDDAGRELRQCCGATRWIERMLVKRPFRDVETLFAQADEVWKGLSPDDWLAAFKAHPRIGERRADKDTGETASRWSSQEQSGMAGAEDDVRTQLAELNRDYEEKFGYIFIICAADKTPDQMLKALRERLEHSEEEELPVAAEEQRRITRLRLEKLLTS